MSMNLHIIINTFVLYYSFFTI